MGGVVEWENGKTSGERFALAMLKAIRHRKTPQTRKGRRGVVSLREDVEVQKGSKSVSSDTSFEEADCSPAQQNE